MIEPELWNLYSKPYEYISNISSCYGDVINLIFEDTKYKKNILDIGCGSGSLIKKLLDYNPNKNITGIDISSSMIELAKEKLDEEYFVHLILGSVEKEKIFDSKYDAINLLNVLPFLDNPLQILKNSYNCLEKGGLCSIVTPTEETDVVNVGRRLNDELIIKQDFNELYVNMKVIDHCNKEFLKNKIFLPELDSLKEYLTNLGFNIMKESKVYYGEYIYLLCEKTT